jgi:cytochrome c oxidase subunit 4
MNTAHIGPRAYLWNFVALITLALLSYLMSFLHLGGHEMTVAMVIAFVKALLVVLIFMHLVEHTASARIVAFTAAAFVAILLSLIITDVANRTTTLAPTTAERPPNTP